MNKSFITKLLGVLWMMNKSFTMKLLGVLSTFGRWLKVMGRWLEVMAWCAALCMALLMCLQVAGIHIITQRQFDIFYGVSYFLYAIFILPKHSIKNFQPNIKIMEEARQVGGAHYRNALIAVYGLPIGKVLLFLIMMGAFFWWLQSGGRDQSGSVILAVLGMGLGLFVIVLFGFIFWFSRKFPFVSEAKQKESDANGETDRTTTG